MALIKRHYLFVECSIAKLFWNKFTNWYNASTGRKIAPNTGANATKFSRLQNSVFRTKTHF